MRWCNTCERNMGSAGRRKEKKLRRKVVDFVQGPTAALREIHRPHTHNSDLLFTSDFRSSILSGNTTPYHTATLSKVQ